MPDFLDIFSRVRELPPHGYCLLWQPGLIWTHVVADALIAAAYFSIPLALVRFVTRRTDIAFSWIFWLFALFIVACGTTHLMSIWTLWNPDYGFEALIKVITAVASVGTAIVLWPMIPKALALPSPLQLRAANEALAARVEERDAALARLTGEIAERERAEAALVQAQKMEAVGQLTGGLAHDFNNLLQAVSGMFALIARSPGEADKVRTWAERGLRVAERGTHLTSQLLAFARIRTLDLKPVAIGRTIGTMLDLVRRTIGTGIRIETRLADGGALVTTDKAQLELALLNLALNARDAMPDGGTLVIATARVDDADPVAFPDGAVEVRVTDTGTGMTPETIERAFEPFFTTKPIGEGTGLGLSMVFGIVEQSGGAIRIESLRGRGTSVIMTFRRHRAGEAPAEESGGGPEAEPPSGDGELLLVVDDDEDVRASIRQMLESLGYRVIDADGGPAALALLEEHEPAAAIIDFAMPGLTGDEVGRLAAALRPSLRIAYATGLADAGALERAVGRDAPVLSKPFRLDALARFVAGLLAARAPERE